jgi:hypothetical protein
MQNIRHDNTELSFRQHVAHGVVELWHIGQLYSPLSNSILSPRQDVTRMVGMMVLASSPPVSQHSCERNGQKAGEECRVLWREKM